MAMLLAHQPIPSGRRVGILTNAGGPGILAADACAARGLEVPALSSKIRRTAAILPSGGGEHRQPGGHARRGGAGALSPCREDPSRRRGARCPPRHLHPADRVELRDRRRGDRRWRGRRAQAGARHIHERPRRTAGPRADSLLPVPGVGGDRARARGDLRRMEARGRRQNPRVEGRRCRSGARHRRLRPRARRRLALPGRGRGAADGLRNSRPRPSARGGHGERRPPSSPGRSVSPSPSRPSGPPYSTRPRWAVSGSVSRTRRRSSLPVGS